MMLEYKTCLCYALFIFVPLLCFGLDNYLTQKGLCDEKYIIINVIQHWVCFILYILLSFYFKYIATL